jgi:dephospho-CoA kinase
MPLSQHTPRLLCFVGLHGVGKSTIAKAAARTACGIHISVGDLCRAARRGKVPEGWPVRLIAAFARHAPGSVLADETAELLLEFVSRIVRKDYMVFIDGFPSSVGHIDVLESNDTLRGKFRIVMVECDDELRKARLLRRASETGRKWRQDMDATERDLGVAQVVDVAMQRSLLKHVRNDGGPDGLDDVVAKVLS